MTAYWAAPVIGAHRRITASVGELDGVTNAVASAGPVRFMTGAHLSATIRLFVHGDVLLGAVTLRTRQ